MERSYTGDHTAGGYGRIIPSPDKLLRSKSTVLRSRAAALVWHEAPVTVAENFVWVIRLAPRVPERVSKKSVAINPRDGTDTLSRFLFL